MTIFLTPFMPCATMMPAVLAVVGVFAGDHGAIIAPLVYVLAILFIILSGVILKKTAFKGDPAPFVMELPEYKLPTPKGVWHFVWDRTKSFFAKVTSIIFVSTVIVWFLKYFGFSRVTELVNGMETTKVIFGHVEMTESLLADIGKILSPIFAPLGFGDWRLIAAMLTAFVAKDNLQGTLAVLLATEFTTPDTLIAALSGILTPAAAVGFLLFFLLSSPCFASIGAMRKELGSRKLTLAAVAFQCGTAYFASLFVYTTIQVITQIVGLWV